MTGNTITRFSLKRLSSDLIARSAWHLLRTLLSIALLAVVSLAGDATAGKPSAPRQGAAAACVRAADADVRQLDSGTVIEREIGGGQSHYYEIAVSAKQFLRVIVDQRGVDLGVSICGPGGNQLAKVDRPNGTRGPESVSAVIDQAETVTLNVKSLDRSAPAANYQVRIAEQRSPQSGDEARLEAEKALSEGETLRARGKPDALRAAVEKFELARTLWQSLGEPYEEALAYYGLGWSHSEIGSYGMVKFPIPVHRLRWSYESRSEHETAIECFKHSLEIMRRLDDSYGQAIALAGLGWPQLYLGLSEEALESFETANRLFRGTGSARGEAIVLYGIGWVNAIRGEDQKALDGFLKALPLRQASKDRKGEAITLAGISRVQNRLGRNQEAIDYAQRALTIFDELRDTHGQASTYSTLGWINFSLGEMPRALESFEKALSIRREAGDSTGEANSLYGIARVYDQQRKPDEALKRMQEVLGIIEPLRAIGGSSDLRTYYFANVQEYYEFYVDLLMRLDRTNPGGGYVEAAVAAHERSKARELLAVLAETGDISPGTGAELSRPLGANEIKGLLDGGTLLLEYSLGGERSYVWAVSNNEVRGYEIPSRAEIEGRAQKLYSLLTARNRRVPGENEAQRRSRIEQADAQYAVEAAALSRALFGPVASSLGKKRLVIVVDGALQLIPFGALPAPSPAPKRATPPLILDHEIVSLPSASVLSALRREIAERAPAPSSLAVLADPVFSADDPRVRRGTDPQQKADSPEVRGTDRPGPPPASWISDDETAEVSPGRGLHRLLGTRWEGQQIASLVPAEERLLALDFDASRSRVLRPDFARYRIIHFATHALIDDTNPASSEVVLSQVDEQGRRQDGSLSLHDIHQLKLRADLVVLSACRTGLGGDIRGEGMTGLAGGFMHAGVPRVVVSQWPVNDKVTAEFMVRFYRQMLGGRGVPAAAALRGVQIQMLMDARWKSPYFWAPFIIQGEWK